MFLHTMGNFTQALSILSLQLKTQQAISQSLKEELQTVHLLVLKVK